MNAAVLAKKIAESKAASGGNFFKDGKGIAIAKLHVLDGKPRFYNGDTFVAELFIESNEAIPGPDGKPLPTNPVGTTVSFVQLLEKNPDVAYGNVKAYLLALMGETDESLAVSAVEEKVHRAKQPNGSVTGLAQQPDGTWDWTIADQLAATIAAATNEKANPCRGMRVRYETFHKVAKKSGNDLCLVKFSPLTQTPEMVQQARAMLDGREPPKAS